MSGLNSPLITLWLSTAGTSTNFVSVVDGLDINRCDVSSGPNHSQGERKRKGLIIQSTCTVVAIIRCLQKLIFPNFLVEI